MKTWVPSIKFISGRDAFSKKRTYLQDFKNFWRKIIFWEKREKNDRENIQKQKTDRSKIGKKIILLITITQSKSTDQSTTISRSFKKRNWSRSIFHDEFSKKMAYYVNNSRFLDKNQWAFIGEKEEWGEGENENESKFAFSERKKLRIFNSLQMEFFH